MRRAHYEPISLGSPIITTSRGPSRVAVHYSGLPPANFTTLAHFAGEGWGGEQVVRAYDKRTGAVVGEVNIPGMMGSMPMTYMVNGKQYIAFTVGTRTNPAEVVALALDN